MKSKREKTLSRQMRKVILVICEGETEENYVTLLKKWFKSPIRVISRVEGSKITPSLVENRVRELHKSAINADSVIKELKNSASVWMSYNKASFSDTQKAFLKDKTEIAMERAMRLKEFENPSTGVYKLILKLTDSKRGS